MVCAGDRGSAVVGPVERLIAGVIEGWPRMLVAISPDTGPESNFRVPGSPLIDGVADQRRTVSTTVDERVVHLNAMALGAAFHSIHASLWQTDVADCVMVIRDQDMPCSSGIGDAGPSGIASSCCSGTPLRY